MNLLDNLEILVDDYGEPLFEEGQYKILPNKKSKKFKQTKDY